jgi:large subunit ribosomal protein L24
MKKIKKGDVVVVRVGKDKGKEGTVTEVLKNDKLLVKGINQVKKHQKGNPNAGLQGGIVNKDMPIDVSNVGLLNPETKKADRVGFRILEDGKKVRYFKSTNQAVDA